jgi:nucleoid-associated protein YgaU
MPNDAKLGLVAGVVLVIVVAVVFFRKEAPAGQPAATSVKTLPPAPPAPGSNRAALARTTAVSPVRTDQEPAARRHTVREGETLFGLAQRYYGDGAKFAAISEGNGWSAAATEPLPPGTVLVIPDLPEHTFHARENP